MAVFRDFSIKYIKNISNKGNKGKYITELIKRPKCSQMACIGCYYSCVAALKNFPLIPLIRAPARRTCKVIPTQQTQDLSIQWNLLSKTATL